MAFHEQLGELERVDGRVVFKITRIGCQHYQLVIYIDEINFRKVYKNTFENP